MFLLMSWPEPCPTRIDSIILFQQYIALTHCASAFADLPLTPKCMDDALSDNPQATMPTTFVYISLSKSYMSHWDQVHVPIRQNTANMQSPTGSQAQLFVCP
jgi:hypothetical protein